MMFSDLTLASQPRLTL
uniref:Uncharacterized protein n=1 Tax=Anguilla anguilla TaxID=7936 RepID=A0A0E9R4Y6_ANGAN